MFENIEVVGGLSTGNELYLFKVQTIKEGKNCLYLDADEAMFDIVFEKRI